MHYILYSLNVLIMVSAPLLLGTWIAHKFSARWGLFGMGAVTFVVSQIFHLPFNWYVDQAGILPDAQASTANLVVVAVFAGLSAGVFEEVARYLTYRYWATDARTWAKGLMLGAGHGGVEAIILGAVAALNIGFLFAFQSGELGEAIPAEQLPLIQAQADALFSAPWYDTLLGGLERLFALANHLAMSLLVLQVFVRGKGERRVWLLAAIGWHALLDFAAVFALSTWNVYVTEALVGVMAVASVGVVYWLRRPEPAVEEPEPLPEAGPAGAVDVEVTEEKLDESRFT